MDSRELKYPGYMVFCTIVACLGSFSQGWTIGSSNIPGNATHNCATGYAYNYSLFLPDCLPMDSLLWYDNEIYERKLLRRTANKQHLYDFQGIFSFLILYWWTCSFAMRWYALDSNWTKEDSGCQQPRMDYRCRSDCFVCKPCHVYHWKNFLRHFMRSWSSCHYYLCR